MSGTRRMKEAQRIELEHRVGEIWRVGCRLERELNAAQRRIRRLEEAGDALKAAGYFGGWADAVNKWVKVKEDKP